MNKDTKNIPINVISQHRSELMGIGIVLVMICHGSVRFGPPFQQVYSVIRQFCQIGVDMFLFLSGLGIYYSLSKFSNILGFYKKRFIRLFLPYTIVLIIWGIAQLFHNTTGGIVGFVYSYSLITFFLRGDLSEWYIAAIISLYLLSPWLVMYIRRNRKGLYVLILATILLSFLLLYGANSFPDTKYGKAFKNINDIFIVRIPMFLIGLVFGKVIHQKKEYSVSVKRLWVIIMFGIALFLVNTVVFPGKKLCFSQWYISRAIFGLICIPLLLLIGYSISLIDSKLTRNFGWLGTITLELYLLHEKIQGYLDSLLPKTFLASILSNVLAILISLPIAYLVNTLAKEILLTLKNRRLTQRNSNGD